MTPILANARSCDDTELEEQKCFPKPCPGAAAGPLPGAVGGPEGGEPGGERPLRSSVPTVDTECTHQPLVAGESECVPAGGMCVGVRRKPPRLHLSPSVLSAVMTRLQGPETRRLYRTRVPASLRGENQPVN